MPIIRIDYDKDQIGKEKIVALTDAVQKIVSARTEIKEVMVYVNSNEIVYNADPVEIFIEMSAHIMEKHKTLTKDVKSDLIAWKKETDFPTLINLTLIPMKWEMEIGI